MKLRCLWPVAHPRLVRLSVFLLAASGSLVAHEYEHPCFGMNWARGGIEGLSAKWDTSGCNGGFNPRAGVLCCVTDSKYPDSLEGKYSRLRKSSGILSKWDGFINLACKASALRIEHFGSDNNRNKINSFENLQQVRSKILLLFACEQSRPGSFFKFCGPSFRAFELCPYLDPLAFRHFGFGFCLSRLHLVKMESNKDSDSSGHPANQGDDKRQVVNTRGGFEEFEHRMMAFSALICGLGVGFATGVWYAWKSASENSLANAEPMRGDNETNLK